MAVKFPNWLKPSWATFVYFWAGYGLLLYLCFEFMKTISNEQQFLIALFSMLAFYVAELIVIPSMIVFTIYKVLRWMAGALKSKPPEL